jgi:hypothetical protein
MIITLEELKGYLNIKSPNNDHKLSPLTDYVNDFIVRFCSIKSGDGTTDLTRRETSPSGRSIILPSTNVTNIVSIKSNGTLIEAEDYYLDSESGIVVFYTDVSTKPFGIEVVYKLDTFTPPADLKMAAMELAKYIYSEEYKETVSNGNGEAVTAEISKTIPNKIRHILLQHREI